MGTTFILTAILVGLCVLLIGIRIFFVKGGKFPNTHIEGNEALKNKGIRCAHSETEKEK